MAERVIQILHLVSGEPTAFDGQYVISFDPSKNAREPGTGREMTCTLVTTSDLAKASRYRPDVAVELYRAVDASRPVRRDGKPNRPMTAWHVMIVDPQELTTNPKEL